MCFHAHKVPLKDLNLIGPEKCSKNIHAFLKIVIVWAQIAFIRKTCRYVVLEGFTAFMI
jgi:hypothetical protein